MLQRAFTASKDVAEAMALGAQAEKPRLRCSKPIGLVGVQSESPLAWSSNGEWLAFVAGNKSIFVLQRHPDGRFSIEYSLYGHHFDVKCLSFHPADANVLISGGLDGLLVWNVSQQRTTLRISPETDADSAHEADVECMCWAHDGTALITGSKDTNVKVWDAADGYKLLETIYGHKAPVLAVQFNVARQMLATAGRDSTIKVWDASSLSPDYRARRADDKGITCQLQANMDGHRGDVTTLTFSIDGNVLFSGARDNGVKAWSLHSFVEIRDIKDGAKGRAGMHRADVRRLLLLHGGRLMLSASMDSTLHLYELGALAGHADTALEAEEVKDEAKTLELLLSSKQASVVQMEHVSDTLRAVIAAHPDEGVCHMELNVPHGVIATASGGNCVRLWDIRSNIATPQLLQEFVGHHKAIADLFMLPDGRRMVTCSEDFTVNVYDVETMKRQLSFNFEASVLTLAVQQTVAPLAFVGGTDYTIKVFSLQRDTYLPLYAHYQQARVPDSEFVLAHLTGHSGKVRAVDVDPSGQVLVSGGEDYRLLVWHIPESMPPPRAERRADEILRVEPVQSIDAHSGHITDVKFSTELPGPRVLLASCGNNHSLHVWHLRGTHLRELWSVPSAHAAAVSCVTWGRGRSAAFLFSGGWDRVIKVWAADQNAGVPMAELHGHEARLTQLDVVTRGDYLLSASADFTVRLWDTQAPHACVCVYSHSEAVTAVSAGPQGFISGADNGMVRLWPVPEDSNAGAFERFEAEKDKPAEDPEAKVAVDPVSGAALMIVSS